MISRSLPRPNAVALTLLVIGLGGCAAVGLWVHDTAVFTPSLGNELTNAGRILGLVGGYLLAVQLVLMARVPWLENAVGTQRLSHWHASLGRYLVGALTAHALLIVWGYASTTRRGRIEQTTRLWTGYPGVLLATVALALLVAVGATSARAARRRMRYETWHLLHLCVYLAVGLTFTHVFANGAEFARSPRNRLIWTAMFAVAIGLVVLFRFVLPAVRGLRRVAHVERVVAEAPDVVSVHLHGPGLTGWPGRPGQFVRLRFMNGGGWWQSHPFSVSANARDSRLRVTVKQVGDHTRSLSPMCVGTRVVVTGPYGALTEERCRSRKILLIGAGIGVTPLVPLLETLPAAPGELTLVYRASSADHLVLGDEIDAVAAQRGARVHYVLGSRHDVPIDAQWLRGLVPDAAEHDVFVCGPAGFVHEIRAALRSLGVPRTAVHTEQFTL